MPKPKPAELLSRVAELQQEFWDAIGELEKRIGIVLDSNTDFSAHTIASLKKHAKEY